MYYQRASLVGEDNQVTGYSELKYCAHLFCRLDMFPCLLIRMYRCGGDDERMVRNLPYPCPVGVNFC